ncbi:MAG: hypothetical protein BZY80_02700 [SAR202 cluster bacterium Io17-Chloro-G2]|nr:MAG: hypothetical protein BZY80_02700 [SAR202 cluster bacterium Io17-Chloro-G2]
MSISKRIYESDYRLSLAEATRMKIAGAARKLFVQNGYSTTSIKAIAAEAGVSEPTVYARFGNKKAIIEAIVDSMDTEAGVLELLEAMHAAAEDRYQQLNLIIEFDLTLFQRNLDVYQAALQASSSEPGLGAVLEEGKARGRAGRTTIFQAWEAAGVLRPGLSVSAANDIFTAMVSPFNYKEMVVNCGWGHDRFQAWLKSAVRMLLLVEG